MVIQNTTDDGDNSQIISPVYENKLEDLYFIKKLINGDSKILNKNIKKNVIVSKELRKNDPLPQTERLDYTSPADILAPLDAVFIDDILKDDIVTHTAIPELLEGTIPGYSGVILFGPPGTGKTVLLEAIAEVYSRAGSFSESVFFAQINSMYVGEFAKNLEKKIEEAKAEARKRGKQSFLFFDEADILIEQASIGASTVSKHYQEAISVLKKYVGNDPERNVVIAISTNGLPKSFEAALTREGRLTTYFIGYPDNEQKKRMWQYFSNKSEIAVLNDEQAYQLAGDTALEQGAFIEEFCRNYHAKRRTAVLKEKGYTTLVAALKKGVTVYEKDVTATYSFDTFQKDVVAALTEKYARLEDGAKEKKEEIGFRPESN